MKKLSLALMMVIFIATTVCAMELPFSRTKEQKPQPVTTPQKTVKIVKPVLPVSLPAATPVAAASTVRYTCTYTYVPYVPYYTVPNYGCYGYYAYPGYYGYSGYGCYPFNTYGYRTSYRYTEPFPLSCVCNILQVPFRVLDSLLW
jgi:hypothetical protein